MNYKEIRRFSLIVFIGFLILTALIAIISVLSGTFGEVHRKILGTTLTISGASICSMVCAVFMEKKKRVPVAAAGIALCVITAVLIIAGIWSKIHINEYWNTISTCGVLGLAFTYSFLLALPDLGGRQKWVQPVSFISIGILALLIIPLFWVADMRRLEFLFRPISVVAILVVLETLVIPILVKLRKSSGHTMAKLVLEKIEGDIYEDTAGRKYLLKPLDTAGGIEK